MDSSQELKLYIISGTHWDREWYEDFQHYRFRLVRMMDDLIHHMEEDAHYRVFHMDGQTIVLRDYLAIRPENRGRLTKLIRDGRIVIGPWYVMPDEFLIGGESLIKNLQIGHAICHDFGVEPLHNGYVPDIFGHNSQLPQILRGFGLDSALLFRGIADYDRDAFLWRASDGSEVWTIKLDKDRSYSNFYFAVRWPYEQREFDPQDAVKRMKDLLALARHSATSDCLVMMDGVDHIDMEPRIPELIRLFESEIPGIRFYHTTLDDYVKALRQEEPHLEVLSGALYHIGRCGVNNHLLKNVLSSTVPLKQQNDRCEKLLIQYAEPLNACYGMVVQRLLPHGENDYDARPRRKYLDTAWDYLIQNQPHDSICGCSQSNVHRDNEYRFRQAADIAQIMIQDVLANIAPSIRVPTEGKDGRILLFNPSQTAWRGPFVTTIYTRARSAHNFRFYDSDGKEIRVQLLQKSTFQSPNHRLRQLISFDRMEKWTAAVDTDVPAMGYATLGYNDLRSRGIENFSYGAVETYPVKRLVGSLKTGRRTFCNGVYELTVHTNGTLKIRCLATGRVFDGLLTFEDSADAGNGWIYRKVSFDRQYYGTAGTADYAVESDGPLASVICITRYFRIPVGLSRDGESRSDETVEQAVITEITLVKDNPVIVFHTRVENRATAHRLRVIFPTGLKTDSFYTKLPFDMYRWPVQAEEYAESCETETFVHPSQGVTFLTDGQDTASLYARGLYEIEVTDDDERSIALTLFRSPAEETGAEEPDYTKLFTGLSFDYALSFADRNAGDAYLAGEKWRAGLTALHFDGTQKGQLPARQSFLSLNARSTALSLLRLEDEAAATYELRLVEIAGQADTATVRLPERIGTAVYVDFLGHPAENVPFDGNEMTVTMPPHKIVTVRFTLRHG